MVPFYASRSRAGLCAALGMAAMLSAPSFARDKFVPSPPSAFKPEMLVTIAYPGWTWCRTYVEYQEYTVHLLRGETTKVKDLEDRSRCGPIPAGDKYKVVAVKRVGKYAMLELVPSTSDAADGYWTMHEGMRPAR